MAYKFKIVERTFILFKKKLDHDDGHQAELYWGDEKVTTSQYYFQTKKGAEKDGRRLVREYQRYYEDTGKRWEVEKREEKEFKKNYRNLRDTVRRYLKLKDKIETATGFERSVYEGELRHRGAL